MKKLFILPLMLFAALTANAQNPYLPLWEHLPDGEPRVFEDPDNPGKLRAYIIGSHDTKYTDYCGSDIRMWSAPVEDLSQWRDEGPIFTHYVDGQWDTMFAPDLVEVKDKATGKKTYYLYPHSRGWQRVPMVCKGDRPNGPFTPINLTEDGRKCLPGSLIDFDPSVFIENITNKKDKDYDKGFRAYVFYGFQHSTACELDQNTMYSMYDVEIARCDIRSSASAVKFGTASWGGFRKVYVHDIKVSDTFRSTIAIESVDGAQIDSILVERVSAKNTGNPIFIRLGQRAGHRKGTLKNVTIRHFACEVPFGRPDEAYDLRGPEVDFFHNPFPSSICGIPDNRIENIILEDINIQYPGRATKGMAYLPIWRKSDVPEQIQKYPEFTMFGELPAWGFYLRHIQNITLKNVHLSLAACDFRPEVVEEDVDGFIICQ